jgi:hypothetical protein
MSKRSPADSSIRTYARFVALREIATGEELTYDWATTDDAAYAIKCRCGSPACRGIITGKDWQQKDLQRRYRGLFSWHAISAGSCSIRPAARCR